MVKAKRSTAEAKRLQKEKELQRKRDADIFKATLKKKAGDGGDGDDSDWTDVEEDFPHVKLSELLEGLTLEVGGG